MQVGFCTLYTFYAYPDTRRFRLSQILVLPPFQHKGIGAALLRAAYVMADKCNAVDVTVSLTMFSLFQHILTVHGQLIHWQHCQH